MTRYILKRLLIAIPVLLGITLVEYLIMSLAGSPLEMLHGPRVSASAIELRAQQLGLDQPWFVQYFYWLKELLKGNLGYSIRGNEPVLALILRNLGPTLLLMGVSLGLTLLIAIPLGIYSAVHQYSWGDYSAVTLSFVGSSIPGFFLAMVLVYLFSVRLGWLPSSDMYTRGTSAGFGD